MRHDIHSLDQLLAHLGAHGDLRGQVIQELDLRGQTELLRGVSGEHAAFLGCQLDPEAVVTLYESGADLFPPLAADLPFRPYRSGLYTVDELYEGFDPEVEGSFGAASRDSQIYAYYQQLREQAGPIPIMETLALRLHDHAVEDALADLLHEGDKRVVAIMGGHALRRDEPAYLEIARMTQTLTRAGYFVATGGGPGAMEAGNLGAYFAVHDDPALDEAVARLRGETDYRRHRYLQLAAEVRERWPPGRAQDSAYGGGQSLAVPTWFYGHEPSNMFASHVAKYFANSVREDGLLAIATHGVIYAPGSAGTVQEVFMDACQNHYRTFEVISPMVMFGVEHWTERLPVWPLLQAMSAGRSWGELIALCEHGAEVVDFILAHPPRGRAADGQDS